MLNLVLLRSDILPVILMDVMVINLLLVLGRLVLSRPLSIVVVVMRSVALARRMVIALYVLAANVLVSV